MKINKRTIIITLSVAIITSAAAYGGWSAFSRELLNTTTGSIEKNQQLFTQAVADALEQYFYDIQKRVETIASMPSVKNAQRSESCNQELQRLVEVNKQEFNNLGRIDKNGNFICAVNRTIIGEPSSKYGAYFETIAKDPEHKPVMSRLITPSGSASPVIAVHAPVYDAEGKFNGTIGGAVYFEELQKRMLRTISPSENSAVALYDDNLDILYHPNALLHSKNLLSPDIVKLYSPEQTIRDFANRIQSPPADGIIRYSLSGVERQAAYRSAKVIGRYWTVGVAVPIADIQATAKRQKMETLFITSITLFVILSTLCAFMLSHRKSSVTITNDKKE